MEASVGKGLNISGFFSIFFFFFFQLADKLQIIFPIDNQRRSFDGQHF